MKPKATEKDIEKVIDKIKELGYETDISRGIESTIIGIKGDARKLDENLFLEIPVVEKVFRVSKKWKEVSREFHPDNTVVDVNGKVKIGEGFTIIAGPCAIESRDQLFRTAEIVKKAGADILRGGAFKPRTSSYDFQGLGPKGIEYLAQAREEFEIPVVTELLDRTDIELFKAYEIDIYQIGARNCQNFRLLKALGDLDRPILFKRGRAVDVEEFLNAAEYIYSGNCSGKGNHKVILCERGTIKGEKDISRNIPDIPGMIYMKQESHLPIIADPSHSAGYRERVPQLSRSLTAAGIDGLIIEAHYNPENALCDGQQSLSSKELKETIKICREIHYLINNKYK